MAVRFPKCNFYIIGGDQIQELPKNVIGVKNLPHDQIPSFLATKAFYLQLSMSEGFPNALCEAMLSGCTPIVSNVGAMPEIVNDSRLILNRKDPDQLEQIIHSALESNGYHPAQFWRSRIEDNYPLSRRKLELTEAINSL
jgi:glycosyltransferase involved in cell wall biosynthesis